ncbi:MAG: tRNA (N(6)-L-threonylcarbamoyladenosine(37)-C(2))-methylthiotransferase [Bacilli bacterium]
MKFYLETYGCKLNEADSEIIRGLLSEDYEEVLDPDGADFIVLNTCGVIDKTEKKIIDKTKYFQDKGKKVFWTGCLPLITKRNISNGSIGVNNILDVKKVIKEHIHIYNNEKEDKAFLCNLKKRKDNVSQIVAISEGCLGNCSYCGSRFARKELYSFSKENILKEIKEVLSDGAKEILLTSQGLATYGLDRGKQELPELIKEILKIKKDFRLRLGMMSPKFTKKIIDELLELYKDPKMYKFLHLPLQSGDNTLLSEMNRGYNVKDFLDIVSRFRSISEDTILATDIIVGHPKEDEKAFQNTIKIIEEVKPDVLHIFRYSKREGTHDSKLKELKTQTKKQRSRVLVDFYQKYNLDKNKEFLNKEVEVLVIEDNNLARTNSGRAVLIKNGKAGEFKKVKITNYNWNYLIGE